MSNPDQTDFNSESSAQLAALIAAAGTLNAGDKRVSSDTSKARPGRSLPDIAMATRAVSGWYESALGYQASHASASSPQAVSLDDIVRQHVAMRKEWEQREAVSLAAWLTQTLSYAPQFRAINVAPVVSTEPATKARRALLIDDSSDILVTVGAFLEAFGFVVTLASGSDAALEVLANTSIDLLVTDHAMPGMTGRDLAIEALQRSPALRAMIITGYPDLQELKELPPSVMVLAKPFRRAELFARLRALFERQDERDMTTAFAAELCSPSG